MKKTIKSNEVLIEKCSRCGKTINQIIKINKKYFVPKCCKPQFIVNRKYKK